MAAVSCSMMGVKCGFLGSRFRRRRLRARRVRGPKLGAPPGQRSQAWLWVRRLSCARRLVCPIATAAFLAHAYYTHEGTEKSAAHEMLAKGFALVSSEAGECAADLLASERAAREDKLGLWADPYYAIVGAERFTELLAERGHFKVVEGKVWSVRESGGAIYVNFGRRWAEALTVTISKRNERKFAAAGLDPKRLENRRVRVRGWIEERKGPRIEALGPEQIEIAER
jgi:hypothetical protein